MRKSIFTIAFVAVAAISASAFNPITFGHKNLESAGARKTISYPCKTTAHPGKTVALEAAERTQPIVPVMKDYGPMLKNVAHLDNVAFGSHGWL